MQNQKTSTQVSEEIENKETDNTQEAKQIETKTDESNVLIKLNPVQLFIIKQTVLNPDFIETSNRIIDKVHKGNRGFFGFNELYSGDYAGVFTELKPQTESQEETEFNIGAALVNMFVATVLNSGNVSVDTPVTRESVKAFLIESGMNNPTI